VVKYLNQHLDFLEAIIKLFSIHDDLYTDGHKILFALAELFQITKFNKFRLRTIQYFKITRLFLDLLFSQEAVGGCCGIRSFSYGSNSSRHIS